MTKQHHLILFYNNTPPASPPTTAGKGNEAALIMTTLFTQEMLSLGYLANTAVAISFAHTDELLETYIADCECVFRRLAG